MSKDTSMKTGTRKQAGGFTLIEVLVGIVVFAIGMMALAQLQGHLAKSSGESNARTVATNLAEETIEALRTFRQLQASNDVAAFGNIVSGNQTFTRGGNDYAVTSNVTDYYYNPATEDFQVEKPNGDIIFPDLKRVELTVSWGSGDLAQSFRIDGSNSTTALGTGSVTMVDLISSYTTTTAAKVALNNYADGLYAPPVSYNPGQNPDIVSIQLGQNKFKESTTPLPDVIRTDELVETRFDVVTYSQSDTGSTFLRREEFRAVSCECTLQIPASDGEGGLRPSIWNGKDYTEGEFVAKPFGASANNQQSIYCDICCRDHHDGGAGSNDVAGDPGRARYNPFRNIAGYHGEGALAGDHFHYGRDNRGILVLAQDDGDAYLEACRLVRKDGFWRVAQDLRQEGLNSFPGDYLDEESEVGEYSKYVTDAVSAYEFDIGNTNNYEQSPPALIPPAEMSPAVVFPASTVDLASEMADGAIVEQQLRSRGVYVDYMTDELRALINCLDLGGSGSDCEVPDVNSALEIIPFYDVQLTWLARWTETPTNNPIEVTNEAIADDNSHSRGIATLELGFGYSTIDAEVHSGNLGLTGTDPIDFTYGSDLAHYPLYALAPEFSAPPELSNVVISGTITSSVPGVRASDVEIEATGAQCDRTNIGFECTLLAGAASPRLKIFNYFKLNANLVGCSANGTMTIHGSEVSANNWTRFNLPLSSSSDANIVIKVNSC
jgi:type IV pilus modification protein PilV